jgi:hypothetical protein
VVLCSLQLDGVLVDRLQGRFSSLRGTKAVGMVAHRVYGSMQESATDSPPLHGPIVRGGDRRGRVEGLGTRT